MEPDLRTDDELRRAIALEREALAASVEELRGELAQVRPESALHGKLPLAVGVAGALGFLRGGGPGAAMRLLAARRRHHRERESAGLRLPFGSR